MFCHASKVGFPDLSRLSRVYYKNSSMAREQGSPSCLCYSGAMHYLGLRHKHKRSKTHRKESKSRYIIFLDKLTFVVGVIGPFTVLPQIYTIFSTHSALGVSAATWLLIFVVTFPWILYGIAHKDKSIIISFTLWEVVNLTVVVGVLLYT